jgi:hypothetical protein
MYVRTSTINTVTINMRESIPHVNRRADVPALHVLEPINLLASVGSVGFDLHSDTKDSALLLGLKV